MSISLRTQMLVHGNAFSLQFPGGADLLAFTESSMMDHVQNHPWTDVVGERQGPGIVFRGKERNRNFFHVSIPAPNSIPVRSTTVITPDGDPPPPPHFYFTVPAQLINVFVTLSRDPGVTVQHILVFDGVNPIQSVAVNNSRVVNGVPFLTNVGQRPVQTGLGISLDVRFNQAGNITFHGAGAEFQFDNLP